MPSVPTLTFADSATFEQNVASFSSALSQLEPKSGPFLSAHLSALADGTQGKPALLNSLFTALSAPDRTPAQGQPAPSTVPSPGAASTSAPPRWFFDELEIEGFRGINNENTPLLLKFKAGCVSSVSAPNGVGKSSIFDAITYALKGKIEKLDQLQQAERPQDYYLNRFHPSGSGMIKLTFRPDNADPAVTITVTRSAAGLRTVSGPVGIDCEALLTQLNREFVLLDSQTFNIGKKIKN